MGKLKSWAGDLLKVGLLAAAFFALIRLVPGVKDFVNKYVTGGTV